MGWLYIVIRTFPFWAIPISLTFISLVMTKKGSRVSGKMKLAYLALAGFLGVGSVAFLVFNGPNKAVPMVHEFLYNKE